LSSKYRNSLPLLDLALGTPWVFKLLNEKNPKHPKTNPDLSTVLRNCSLLMAANEDGNTFQPGDHIQRRRFGALAAKELAVGPIDLLDFCHGTLPRKYSEWDFEFWRTRDSIVLVDSV
jgi:hypothetical protein